MNIFITLAVTTATNHSVNFFALKSAACHSGSVIEGTLEIKLDSTFLLRFLHSLFC